MNHDVKDFEKDVLERSKQIPVVVDFWAEWCGPCRILGPVLERLSSAADGRWQLAKVNTEEMPDVAARYNIRSIPNVKLFVDGVVVAEFIGSLPEPLVKQWLKKHIPSKHRHDLRSAEELLLQNKTKEAQALLENILVDEPENQHASALLAKTYLYTNQQKALDLVRDIAEDSEFFDIAEAIRTFASLLEWEEHPEKLPDDGVTETFLTGIRKLSQKDFAGALEAFIEVIRINRYYNDDSARKACVAIFKILGEDNEITKRYRREFSRALY